MKDMGRIFNAIDEKVLVIALLVLLLALGGGLAYANIKYQELEKYNMQLEEDVATLEDDLEHSETESRILREALEEEQDRLRDLGEQVEDLTGTVGDLEKLNELDEELLQKYSKVYFLNEHYEPDDLATIDQDYVYDEDEREQIHEEVEPFLEDMLEDAEDDDVTLWIVSAYRSFGEQLNLKDKYVVTYGAGTANQFSAEQGYSEHQLGTTVDFTTEGLNGGLSGFENTEAYRWLLDNAYKYGFILSYPQNNIFYQFEPWHWRFVGEELARDLHRDNDYFYDWPQRNIDDYLIEIFE